MLCVIKHPEWKYRLIVTVPLFLVDEVLAVASWGIRMARFSRFKKVCNSVEYAWRSVRNAGPFTLVEVNGGDGTQVEIRLI
ncbi:MAG: hypothetical protein Q8S19_00560 [Bacillota bacterium]|nr:hypothetical protein [Bacillota bacterium]